MKVNQRFPIIHHMIEIGNFNTNTKQKFCIRSVK